MFSFNISKVFLLLFVLYFLKYVFFLSNRHWKCQEFLVQNVRIISGMSGICDLRLDGNPEIIHDFNPQIREIPRLVYWNSKLSSCSFFSTAYCRYKFFRQGGIIYVEQVFLSVISYELSTCRIVSKV